MKERLGNNSVQFYREKIKAALRLWLMLSSGNGMGSVVAVGGGEGRSCLRMGML